MQPPGGRVSYTAPMELGLERARTRGLALVAAAALAALGACTDASPGSAPATAELRLHAAASLRDVLAELQPELERELGLELVLNLGSSGDLARQIVAAGQADVFFCADERDMDRLEALALLEPGTRRDMLGNSLVVIEPLGAASRFTAPFDAAQLGSAAIERLSLAHVEIVPAGRYARQWLEQQGVWPAVRERVVPGVDVRAALAAVESGAVQAGIVYRTESLRSKRVRVVHEVPREQAPRIVYPIAMLAECAQPQAARSLLDWLRSARARAAFERHGFGVIDEGG